MADQDAMEWRTRMTSCTQSFQAEAGVRLIQWRARSTFAFIFAFAWAAGSGRTPSSRKFASTRRTVVDFFARQPVARAEVRKCGEHLVLETAAAFEIGFCRADIGQNPTDQRADGHVLLGRQDSGAPVHVNCE